MNIRSIGLVSVLLLACWPVGQAEDAQFNYEEFRKNSVLFDLKSKDASFSSDIEVVDPIGKSVSHVEEKFSFGLKIGEYVGQEIQPENKSRTFTAKVLYLNDISEVYQFIKNTKQCEEVPLDSGLVNYFHTDWAPEIVYDKDTTYQILGEQMISNLFSSSSYYELHSYLAV